MDAETDMAQAQAELRKSLAALKDLLQRAKDARKDFMAQQRAEWEAVWGKTEDKDDGLSDEVRRQLQAAKDTDVAIMNREFERLNAIRKEEMWKRAEFGVRMDAVPSLVKVGYRPSVGPAYQRPGPAWCRSVDGGLVKTR